MRRWPAWPTAGEGPCGRPGSAIPVPGYVKPPPRPAGHGRAVRPEQVERLGIFPVTRWRVADPGRLWCRRKSAARRGSAIGRARQHCAGRLRRASARGWPALLYRGWDNRHVRKRLERIAKGEWAAAAVSAASQDATAASQAAISAAQQAAVAAAVDAATAAAVQAAVGAAQQAVVDGGGAHGHH